MLRIQDKQMKEQIEFKECCMDKWGYNEETITEILQIEKKRIEIKEQLNEIEKQTEFYTSEEKSEPGNIENL